MRRMLKPLLFALALLLFKSTGIAPRTVFAAPGEAALAMFIAYADVPPYYLVNAVGRHRGILADVIEEVVRPLGLAVAIRRLPDKRGWDMLETGEVDVYASAREWVPEPDRFLWTDSFMPNDDVLLCLAGSGLKYAGPESLHGKTVAGIKGFVYPALEAHFGPGAITRLDATSPEAMLELLRLRRADAVLVNRTEILWMFRNHRDLDAGRFRLIEPAVGRARYRFLFPRGRGWEPVIEQFNRRLAEMRRDGSLKAILDRYR